MQANDVGGHENHDDVSVEMLDDSGLEREEERGPDIEVPFDPTKIDIIVKPMTLSGLRDRLENKELDLTPDFQRQANVWDEKRKARLIESVLLRIPLPSFYFSEDAQGNYAVVDGLQRLCALFHFMDVELLNRATRAKLSGLRLRELQYLKELDFKTFKQVDRKFQRRISELEITANIIRASTPPAVKFNVFARLNQGGMPLNAQEIRNAIFPGVWKDHIRSMAEGEPFLKATERKIRTERLQDMEIVLRFVALWSLGFPFERPAGQNLDEFLNATVENVLSNWSKGEWAAAEAAFERGLSASRRVFERQAFRKIVSGGYRKPINRGLFESQMVVFANTTDVQLAKLEEEQVFLTQALEVALDEDSDYSQALLYATGSAESSNVRIRKLRSIINEVLNA